MDVIESHARRLPAIDDRWVPRAHARAELVEGLLDGRVAGPVVHPLDNVLLHIDQLCEGDPDKQFGMTGLQALSHREVLELVATASGFTSDPTATHGVVTVDPERVIDACGEVGDRLALACSRGERVILATGHPVGLAILYMEVGRLLEAGGATLLRPFEGVSWRDDLQERQVRYLRGVGMLTDSHSAKHTHSGVPMVKMLSEVRPDLVFADHGFAGTAIEQGIDTVSIADVNDPALLVARALGRGGPVIVMDDNVQPDAYWPCFQAIASRVV